MRLELSDKATLRAVATSTFRWKIGYSALTIMCEYLSLFSGRMEIFMAKHLIPIFIKYVMTAIVLEIVLLLFSDLKFINILGLALVLTLVAYIIGDMIILPTTNNAVATVADIGITLVVIYLFDYLWKVVHIPFFSSVIAAAMIGGGEWFFHKIVDRSPDSADESDIW